MATRRRWCGSNDDVTLDLNHAMGRSADGSDALCHIAARSIRVRTGHLVRGWIAD
jgi:hypothetical protein